MKKLLFAAFAALTIFSSCSKEAIEPSTKPQGEMVQIEMYLTQPNATTRSFFEEVDVQLGDKERSFSTSGLIIFDKNGDKVFSANINASSSNTATTIAIPRELSGTTCRFYLFANISGYPNVKTEAELFEIKSGLPSASSYNPTQGDFIFSHNRQGFAMVGVKDVEIKPYGFKTFVEIELERALAKVALEIELDENFSLNHDGGTIILNYAQIRNYAQQSYLVHRLGVYDMSNQGSTIRQSPKVTGKVFQHLWYSYETSPQSNPYIFIEGQYILPNGKRTPVEYSIPVSQINGGAIERNHYYRIKGVIKGVGDLNLDATFKVKDWETPPIEDMNIGE